MPDPFDAPLFPLRTVICPGGRAPLQIFEQRYLGMLKSVMRSGEGFVVCLIREGRETGASHFYDLGTLVYVVDFQSLENGMLGVTIEARDKVSLADPYRQEDGLYRGSVSIQAAEPKLAVPQGYGDLTVLLEALLKHPVMAAMGMQIDPYDARDLGWRLTDLLPIPLEDKQYLLALQDPLQRLEQIRYLLHTLE